jgi:hypothetical protein
METDKLEAMTNGNDMEFENLRGERLQVMLTLDELRALDDFRFKRRMPSRAAAIRELLRRGLAADGFTVAPDGAKSKQFGVTDGRFDGRPAGNHSVPKPNGGGTERT